LISCRSPIEIDNGAYSSSEESDINVGNEFRAVKENDLSQTTTITPEKGLKIPWEINRAGSVAA
jgi:hypothetical protein